MGLNGRYPNRLYLTPAKWSPLAERYPLTLQEARQVVKALQEDGINATLADCEVLEALGPYRHNGYIYKGASGKVYLIDRDGNKVYHLVKEL